LNSSTTSHNKTQPKFHVFIPSHPHMVWPFERSIHICNFRLTRFTCIVYQRDPSPTLNPFLNARVLLFPFVGLSSFLHVFVHAFHACSNITRATPPLLLLLYIRYHHANQVFRLSRCFILPHHERIPKFKVEMVSFALSSLRRTHTMHACFVIPPGYVKRIHSIVPLGHVKHIHYTAGTLLTLVPFIQLGRPKTTWQWSCQLR